MDVTDTENVMLTNDSQPKNVENWDLVAVVYSAVGLFVAVRVRSFLLIRNSLFSLSASLCSGIVKLATN